MNTNSKKHDRSWVGQQVGNFQIIETIAKGGFGEVYRALDLKLDREVAIKFLKKSNPAEQTQLSNLKHEAKAASALNHPNICTIYELGEAADQVYIVMELLDGKTLKKSLPKTGFELDHFLDLALQIAEGLREAHDHNIVHRDIKPGNIQITARNQIKILDFGLAKRHSPENALDSTNKSADSHAMGTLHYMSPEQILGQRVDYRSDIFSLGIVYYQMLTGKLPFKQDSLYATMDDIVNLDPPPLILQNPQIPRPIARVVARMLDKEPEKRFDHISKVIEELQAFETKIHTPPPRPIWPMLSLALLPLFLLAGGLLWRTLSIRPTLTLAIQPWGYQGPDTQSVISETLIGLFYQSLQNLPKVSAVPLMTSRELPTLLSANEVAQQLGVDTVLGGQLTVTNQNYSAQLWLHHKGAEKPFWQDEFHGEIGELHTDFRTMNQEVITALKLKLPPDQNDGLGGKPGAISAYQKGMKAFEDYRSELDTQVAYSAFHQALKIDPEFAPAHAGLAMTHWVDFVRNANVDHVDKASHEANLAISKAPQRPEGYIAAGMVALGRGRTHDAIDLFRQAQDLAPADESIAVRIGDAYNRLNRSEQAEHMYQQAIGLRPGFWVPYLKLGRLFFRTNKAEKAAEMFQKIIDLNPEIDTGYNNLAAVYMSQGNFQGAAPLLTLELKYNPSTEAYSNLGFCLFTLHRFDDAAEQFNKAIELSPNDPFNYGNLGDALRHAGRQEEAFSAYGIAIDNLQMRLRINPRNWDQKAIVAMYLACANRCQESNRLMEELSGHWNAERHYYAAIGYAVCGNSEKTRNHIRKALAGKFTTDISTNPDLKPYLDSSLLSLLENE